MRILWLTLACIVCSVPAFAATATLDWTDVATNEAGYKIERALGVCAPTGLTWAEVGEVGVNAKQYIDNAPVDGNRYCWRIRAWNLKFATDPASIQYSGYSNLAGKDFPLPGAAAPTGLTAN